MDPSRQRPRQLPTPGRQLDRSAAPKLCSPGIRPRPSSAGTPVKSFFNRRYPPSRRYGCIPEKVADAPVHLSIKMLVLQENIR